MTSESVEHFHVERVSSRVLHDLRRRVLRSNNPEISVADPRDEDETSLHFAGLLGDRVVVSASFYPCVAPMNPELATHQLRYMATDFDVQGCGYGARVLEVAESELRALGTEQVWANGRDTALGFYRATRWQCVEGSEHLSPETQLPHTVIYKVLVKH
ncbi:MAG TPA: GNAT family N-acetyltransferase [Acidimicrobiales bacterium]|nr:GNAT family N-acetyltransferase [Acidimicrobiales bacterium]